MVHQTFECPSCRQLGFLDIDGNGTLADLIDAVCHYCGHVVTRDEIVPPQRPPGSANRPAPEPRR